MTDDKKSKTKYLLVPHGNQVRVVENSTDLVLRTLDTRDEAIAFVNELDPTKKEKK